MIKSSTAKNRTQTGATKKRNRTRKHGKLIEKMDKMRKRKEGRTRKFSKLSKNANQKKKI